MLHIRKAKVSEAQTILELHAETVRKINCKDYDKEQIEAWIGRQRVDKIEKAIRSGYIIICVDDSRCILGMGSRVGDQIHGLYVAADHQREGVGSKLLAKMEKDAKLEGVTELCFLVTLTALPFYLSQGYHETARENWPLSGGKSLEAVKIKKNLVV